MNRYMMAAFVFIAFIVGMGVGFSFTPEYALMRADTADVMVPLGVADRNLDLRYIDGMIAHHRSAIYMSEQALSQSKRPEIIELAKTIITADTAGIAKLYADKKSWYGNTRQVVRYTKTNLGSADARFDLRFLNAMIAHHDEAIQVNQEVMGKSTRDEVLNTADDVISSLTKNREQLKTWRFAWYGV